MSQLLVKGLQARNKTFGPQLSVNCRRTFLGGWLKAWTTQRLIYPPPQSEFTTKNRIIPTYITSSTELYDFILFKEPVLLNFTYSDPKSNKVTQALFDILSNSKKYPKDSEKDPVYLVNISADTEGGRELMQTYVVGNQIPAIVVLKKQVPVYRYVPNIETFSEQDLIEWIKTIE
ncbi:uncharacterized protein RJT20DRAFT_135296 [Scheffersomyces xylosifermentans]|uniref:uncharacterized protein n=1 Tax=Scheffersomyces xylosifermentans TaxID=1304137 RepID=UPI00315D6D9F